MQDCTCAGLPAHGVVVTGVRNPLLGSHRHTVGTGHRPDTTVLLDKGDTVSPQSRDVGTGPGSLRRLV